MEYFKGPGDRHGAGQLRDFFSSFFDDFSVSYFFGFWCQLGSNLAPNLGPKPGQMKTESNFLILFFCGMLENVCNCFLFCFAFLFLLVAG